jgi:hypothetical protein
MFKKSKPVSQKRAKHVDVSARRLLMAWSGLLMSSVVVSSEVAPNVDVSGSLSLESRYFWQDPLYEGQGDGLEPSLSFQPEVRWRSEDRRSNVSFVGFVRADEQDSERSHADVRELYWSYQWDEWDITLGINKVFWGVTESRHLVDVINQTDGVEDIDQEDKLGQPMVNLNTQREWGRLSFFALPYFREATYAGESGRFRGPLPVKTDDARYQSGAKEHHLDLALRYSHYFGDLDVGAYWFEGTNREARFELANNGEFLIPVYDQMSQQGLDLQYTRDAWLWKLEAISRQTDVDDFWAAVGGFEYTYYQISDSDADLGVLVEYLYDDRDQSITSAPYQNDVFVGTRLTLNDTQDTSVLVGATWDVENQSFGLNLEAERRIGEHYSLEARVRSFSAVDSEDALYAIRNDDYGQLRFSWYF